MIVCPNSETSWKHKSDQNSREIIVRLAQISQKNKTLRTSYQTIQFWEKKSKSVSEMEISD